MPSMPGFVNIQIIGIPDIWHSVLELWTSSECNKFNLHVWFRHPLDIPGLESLLGLFQILNVKFVYIIVIKIILKISMLNRFQYVPPININIQVLITSFHHHPPMLSIYISIKNKKFAWNICHIKLCFIHFLAVEWRLKRHITILNWLELEMSEICY